MSELCDIKCTPCKGGEPPIGEEELQRSLTQIPEWNVIQEGEVRKLTREFRFKNFQQALEFGNRVGELAEEHRHHPLLCIEWGRTTVTWWTHAIEDLHLNDCVMAAKTDLV
ncbi:MAG: 4a-hydroxytetrahydrobiopterin dehydratase [Spirochaeta sp.]|nr:4a-hydroxytetrahydrobiopterin dehydratase [Spirochaeta sp.]